MVFIKREIILKDWIEYSTCTKCWNIKELNENNFRKNSNWRWYKWYRSQCRECEKIRCKKYLLDNKESIKEYKKEYEITHKEWRKKYDKKYREENKEYIKNYKRIWNDKNRDKIYEQSKLRNNSYEYKEKQKTRRWLYWIDINKRKVQIKTSKYIKENNIRPNVCPICNSERRIISHHVDYSKWNLVVLCCDRCHRLIHSWYLNCPEPIDLLNF